MTFEFADDKPRHVNDPPADSDDVRAAKELNYAEHMWVQRMGARRFPTYRTQGEDL